MTLLWAICVFLLTADAVAYGLLVGAWAAVPWWAAAFGIAIFVRQTQ